MAQNLHKTHTAKRKFCTLFNIKKLHIFDNEKTSGPLKRYGFS